MLMKGTDRNRVNLRIVTVGVLRSASIGAGPETGSDAATGVCALLPSHTYQRESSGLPVPSSKTSSLAKSPFLVQNGPRSCEPPELYQPYRPLSTTRGCHGSLMSVRTLRITSMATYLSVLLTAVAKPYFWHHACPGVTVPIPGMVITSLL